MGSLYVSASEIEVFDLCPRKWAFAYVEGIRLPPNESAALGTRVHSILQFWLRDGKPPDTWTNEGEIAASGLHLLPPPRYPGLVTEEEFRFTSRRAWYTGFKDFRYRDANGLIHVGDHKTTKSSTWMKSVEDILAHPQSLIYAVDEFFKNPSDDRLALDWIYYRTTGVRKAEPRFQIVTKDTVAEMFFEHVDPVAGEITRLHHEVPPGTPALDFKPNFRACEAFGGCAFLSICNPTPTQRTEAIMTQAGMSLADKLKAMKNGRPASPIHPPEAYQQQQLVAVAPMPQVPPPGAPVAATVAVMPPAVPGFALPTPQAGPNPYAGAQAAPQGYPPQAAPQGYPPQAAPQGYPPPAPPQAAPQGYPPPAPPQAAPQGYLPPAPPQAAPQGYLPLVAVPDGSPPAVPFNSMPTPPPVETPPASPVAVPKGKRGRPRKSASAATEIADAGGFILYIGCAPIGVEVVNAFEYANVAHDQLKEKYAQQVPPISHYREILYGKGPAELCKTLEVLLALCEGTENAPSGDVVLGGTQIEEDTASVWLSKASKVVRAFR